MQGDILGFIKNRPNNLLINGLTEIRQRSGIGLAMDANFAYRVQDRFITKVNNIGDFNTRIQSNTILTDLNGVVQEAMNIATNAVNVSAQVFIQQKIESLNAQALANKKASFSFEFLNRGFTDVTVNVYYPTAIDNHTVQTLISSKSEVFAIDATTKKFKFENINIPVEAKNGLAVEIIIDGITIAADWDNPLSKFMLNEGPVAAPFERAGANVTNEFLLCQRYYERGESGAISDSTNANIRLTWGTFHAEKRIQPVVSGAMVQINGAGGDFNLSQIGSFPNGKHDLITALNVAGGTGVGRAYKGTFIADAEL
jgi:hypothetical protein